MVAWPRMLVSGLVVAVSLSAGVAALRTGDMPGVPPQRGGGGGGAPAVPPEPLRFKYMGPATAGRIAAIVGVAGDPTTYYVGSASGGVWKSTDNGVSFTPVFDDESAAAIGTLAVAPSDPKTVWAGTGESWIIRYSDVWGDGVYKSTDAGETWKNMGLPNAGRIARIVVHPTDPNIVYVCAVGYGTGPQKDRGVFKTTDGGATWKQMLFVNDMTGCSGLSLDPSDPNTLVAGTWTFVEHTWGEFTAIDPTGELKGKEGSGVYLTHDGGANWTHATNGLPHQPIGKVDVAIAASNPKRIYALIQTADQGSMWRSDDGGATWAVTSWERYLIGRAGYYIRLAVNPKNPDDVLVSNSSFHQSTDGGKHFDGGGGGGRGAANPGGVSGASCGDCHDIWMDPTNPARYALTDDGGGRIAGGPNGSVSISLPNGQMYHVASDNRVPYWIYSNRQDDGTMRGPSTVSESTGSGRLPEGSLMSAPVGGGGRGGRGGGGGAAAAGAGQRGAPGAAAAAGGGRAAGGAGAAGLAAAGGGGFGGGGGGRGGGAGGPQWQPNIGGCESGFTIPDPTDADIVWATCYGNKVTRWDAKTNTAHSVEPWLVSLDSPPNEAKYRCHWTAPMAIDPFNHNAVYYGCQNVLRTTNEGRSWIELSPDLSTKDPTRVVSNGGLVGDNLGQFDGEVVWAIAPSPIQKGLLWAGTNDGKLWYTKNSDAPGAATWVEVGKNITGLPAWGQFNQISPSSFDPGTAYVAVSLHLMDDRKPYMYKTTDFGATWTKINGDIPTGSPLDYILSLAENPNKKGMLFTGSGHGFYYSLNDGAHWTKFMEGLPPAPVSWINVEKRFHDVDISTYGRGLFILPDISILEQTGQPAPPPTTQLFAPNPIFRMARGVYTGRPHFLFNLASNPSGPVKVEVLTSAGELIKSMNVAAHQGLNAANWDLRYDGPTFVALKTTPPENPHIWDEPRFQGRDTRTITHWGITAQTGTPWAAPGKYQVRLTVGDTVVGTKPFEVLKDPAIGASDADLVASTKMQLEIRDDITTTSKIVNQIEIWRKQIEDQLKSPANSGKTDVIKALTDLNKTMYDCELRLVTKSEMLSDDKYFPEAYRVYMNLIWLSGGVGTGASDEAGGPEFHPTDAQVQGLALIERDLAAAKAIFARISTTDLPAFNKAMAGKVSAIK